MRDHLRIMKLRYGIRHFTKVEKTHTRRRSLSLDMISQRLPRGMSRHRESLHDFINESKETLSANFSTIQHADHAVTSKEQLELRRSKLTDNGPNSSGQQAELLNRITSPENNDKTTPTFANVSPPQLMQIFDVTNERHLRIARSLLLDGCDDVSEELSCYADTPGGVWQLRSELTQLVLRAYLG